MDPAAVNPLITRTGDKTGPDIVRSPHGIGSSIQVGPVVAEETHTVGPRIIHPNTLVALVVLLGFLQELLVGAEVFLVPLTFRSGLES